VFGPNGPPARPATALPCGQPTELVTNAFTIASIGPREDGLAPAIPNFRDVGGHETRSGGIVRSRLLYRSTDLARVGEVGLATLDELGVRTIFDLRTAGERELWPEAERLPGDASYVVADVLRDATGPESDPARMVALLADPARARQLLGGGRGERLFAARYRDFVNLASARQAYHRVLAELARPGTPPAIVHCTTGKDRTGWIVAVLLLLLGVDEDDVMADYLASNAELEPLRQAFYRQFEAQGGDAELLRPFMEARAGYLELGLDEMQRGFGSVEAYVESGLAIGPQTRRHLEVVFLDRA
jgi:protein-tyrosine phosphatase